MNDIRIIIYDIEVLEKVSFIGFKEVGKEAIQINLVDYKALETYMIEHKEDLFVGYNNYGYDNKILNYCLSHKNLKQWNVYQFSTRVIGNKALKGKVEFDIFLGKERIENIDIYHLSDDKAGLKLKAFMKYEYLFENELQARTLEELKRYNLEDLQITEKLYEEESKEEYEIGKYLAEYLKIDSKGHNNLTISKFLNEVAKYNESYRFENCLEKLSIDDDLKQIGIDLLKYEVKELHTKEGIVIKKGGLHYPIDVDFKKKGLSWNDKCYNYDFASFYPNIYIEQLDFFAHDTKALLKFLLKERIQAKRNNETKKNLALKLFINSIYGQLGNIKKEYMYAVAILGQINLIQFLRDNELTLKDVIEINTDGILLKNKIPNLKNNIGIELEEEVFEDVYHQNSNTKFYTKNGKLVYKGQLIKSNSWIDKLVVGNLYKCFEGGKIYNSFIVKYKKQDGLDEVKYYKFKDIADIRKYKFEKNCTLMKKAVLEQAIKEEVLIEIKQYNYEDITEIIRELFNQYYESNKGYELKDNSNEDWLLYNQKQLKNATLLQPKEQKQAPKRTTEPYTKGKPELFNENQLKKQVNLILRWLEKLDPDINKFDPVTNEPIYLPYAKELRAVQRDYIDKSNVKSTLYYHLNTSTNYIYDFIKDLNGKGYDIYYSIFNFRPVRSEYRNTISSKRITQATAQATRILPMDLDGITEEKYVEVKAILKGLGLETLDLNTGHGYQIIILLEDYCYDKTIMKKFTNLLIEKGIPADSAIIDAARIMRLPYTYNCKCMMRSSNYYNQEDPVPVKQVADTEVRYSLEDIFKKLKILPSVERPKAIKSKGTKPKGTKRQEISKEKVLMSKKEQAKLLQKYQTKPVVMTLEPLIQKILLGTPEGIRNNALLFMMPYFRNSKSYTIEETTEILTIWGELCKPKIPSKEIKSMVKQLYQYKDIQGYYGRYTKELEAEYGKLCINFSRENSNMVQIPNEFIRNRNEVPSQAINLYITLLVENLETKDIALTNEELMQKCGMSRSTFYRSIKYLVENGYIERVKRSKKKGEKYSYQINEEQQNNKKKQGYVLVDKNRIAELINKVTTTECFVWLYLKMLKGVRKGSVIQTQESIGNRLERKRNTISEITTSLHKKKIIVKTTKRKSRNKMMCIYDV